ncbi:MAG: hypothetical protein R3C03_10210 [Pirellulaceae bacterium]
MILAAICTTHSRRALITDNWSVAGVVAAATLTTKETALMATPKNLRGRDRRQR